jgi:hypothetical protein
VTEVTLNDISDPQKIARAADIVIAAYGKTSMLDALERARRIEEEAIGKPFARLVREEIKKTLHRSCATLTAISSCTPPEAASSREERIR